MRAWNDFWLGRLPGLTPRPAIPKTPPASRARSPPSKGGWVSTITCFGGPSNGPVHHSARVGGALWRSGLARRFAAALERGRPPAVCPPGRRVGRPQPEAGLDRHQSHDPLRRDGRGAGRAACRAIRKWSFATNCCPAATWRSLSPGPRGRRSVIERIAWVGHAPDVSQYAAAIIGQGEASIRFGKGAILRFASRVRRNSAAASCAGWRRRSCWGASFCDQPRRPKSPHRAAARPRN